MNENIYYLQIKRENLKNSNDYKEIFGSEISMEFEKLKISEDERLIFCHNVKRHFIEAGSHIIKKKFLTDISNFLKVLSCLNPKNINNSEVGDILNICETLPHNLDSLIVTDEWYLLKTENLEYRSQRIDYYW